MSEQSALYDRFMATLVRVREQAQANTTEYVQHHAADTGQKYPTIDRSNTEDIDLDQVAFWTNMCERLELALPDAVRVLRGQTPADPRPNKDLFTVPPPVDPLMTSTVNQWNEIVMQGVTPRWTTSTPHTQRTRPDNHRSIRGQESHIRRHLRAGQLEGRYLIVDSRLLVKWPEVFISPIGVVAKTGATQGDIRLINDYSFPEGKSVNDFTDRGNFPSVSYNPPRDIAKRIHLLKLSHPHLYVLLMLGDVSGAFRHVPVHADEVHMFGFRFKGFLIIDLSCGFGWCGSPAFYSYAGKIINHLYEHGNRLTRQFVGNVWCDDHTCVEVDLKHRCYDANIALRRAMATVLGPTALNQKKFTNWSTKCKALGLLWDTEEGNVSIPVDMLERAIDRVNNLISSVVNSKTSILETIGSLRHVASCSPPALAFLQALQVTASTFPRFGQRKLSTDAINDLQWFRAVLRHPEHFNKIPVADFADAISPKFDVFMDASGDGLCALEPTRQEYLRQRFTATESLELSINIRGLRSAVLAALHWGACWSNGKSRVHVRLHIDNSSAVSWANRRISRHPVAQMYNRLLSLAEFQYNISFTATHIPGKLNVMADAGYRAWDSSNSTYKLWSNMSSSWKQVPLEDPFTDLSSVWAQCCARTLWRTLSVPSTVNTGANGANLQGR